MSKIWPNAIEILESEKPENIRCIVAGPPQFRGGTYAGYIDQFDGNKCVKEPLISTDFVFTSKQRCKAYLESLVERIRKGEL